MGLTNFIKQRSMGMANKTINKIATATLGKMSKEQLINVFRATIPVMGKSNALNELVKGIRGDFKLNIEKLQAEGHPITVEVLLSEWINCPDFMKLWTREFQMPVEYLNVIAGEEIVKCIGTPI